MAPATATASSTIKHLEARGGGNPTGTQTTYRNSPPSSTYKSRIPKIEGSEAGFWGLLWGLVALAVLVGVGLFFCLRRRRRRRNAAAKKAGGAGGRSAPGTSSSAFAVRLGRSFGKGQHQQVSADENNPSSLELSGRRIQDPWSSTISLDAAGPHSPEYPYRGTSPSFAASGEDVKLEMPRSPEPEYEDHKTEHDGGDKSRL